MESVSPHLPGILLSYGAFLMAVASPGPAMLAILGTSMAAGRPSGMGLATGVVTGSLTWGVLTAIGLSPLLAAYASALLVIKMFGGLYLLRLAYKAFRSAASPYDLDTAEAARGQRTGWGRVRRGYIVAMTNPKSVLTCIAVISLGLTPDAPLWVAAVIVGGHGRAVGGDQPVPRAGLLDPVHGAPLRPRAAGHPSGDGRILRIGGPTAADGSRLTGRARDVSATHTDQAPLRSEIRAHHSA